jgi:hypothetical protein
MRGILKENETLFLVASSDLEAAMDHPPDATSLLHHFAALKGSGANELKRSAG